MQIVAQYGDLGPKWFHVSLRVLTLLGKKGTLMTSKELAELTNTESSFIRKVLTKLVEANLVEVKEGKYGGYALMVSPEELNIAEIYLLLSKDEYLKSNHLLIMKTDKKISNIVKKAEESFVNTLREYRIFDLL